MMMAFWNFSLVDGRGRDAIVVGLHATLAACGVVCPTAANQADLAIAVIEYRL